MSNDLILSNWNGVSMIAAISMLKLPQVQDVANKPFGRTPAF